MHCWSIILAAGSGTRLSAATNGVKKQFLEWKGAPLFWHSAITFSHTARVRGLIFVFPEEDLEEAKATLTKLDFGRRLGLPWLVVAGGARRQDSVYNGLQALPTNCSHVLIHDAARPFFSASLNNTLLDALSDGADAVIPALPVTDTIKVVSENTVSHTLDRSTLKACQTPQGFDKKKLLEGHNTSLAEGWEVTDDASIAEQAGISVTTVQGEAANIKITNPEDLAMIEQKQPAMPVPVTGWGYDVHRYGTGRPMKLGGIPIQGAPEVVAHSDGDVLLHALCDAILGCMGDGDIGEHFPDSSEQFDNISSGVLLNEVYDKFLQKGYRLTNVDLTIIAQVPRLVPWKPQIKKNICRMLKLTDEQVNVKATTEEKLGFTGEKKGIKAVAAVMALRG
ncbi:2-C-methyl-D-erythritol 4-phosphate cytidylyltransferase [Halodesulfovibrio sp.]|jgi:2-C-methyl-D-erythritol 4-phosphate cytidylyltransferase/2-C-methyl-D-erythritol 2,4-cyclodiphosphate synthase|uniref:2-C-methyl-D-erythritol 4-phosphate cytidylyltransferase n=1 Tax=Halodesulfovibrio sp. TaxID=1912772 RepID=UPI0025EDF6BA|nr:2-C-methyl-D-erythritol 4-phosphate cytidylyltransferase [Halodesulfovibrio sp.]MCT4627464.1 2-C-methyl-D-erythritol 4-phosphate cytidylyltransferase [Halodesulfovibrio sp.]